MSQHLLNYGSTGIAQSKIMRKLYQNSLDIHKNLITLEATLDDNVMAFRCKERESLQVFISSFFTSLHSLPKAPSTKSITY
jgi:hypothetical protein